MKLKVASKLTKLNFANSYWEFFTLGLLFYYLKRYTLTENIKFIFM